MLSAVQGISQQAFSQICEKAIKQKESLRVVS